MAGTSQALTDDAVCSDCYKYKPKPRTTKETALLRRPRDDTGRASAVLGAPIKVQMGTVAGTGWARAPCFCTRVDSGSCGQQWFHWFQWRGQDRTGEERRGGDSRGQEGGEGAWSQQPGYLQLSASYLL